MRLALAAFALLLLTPTAANATTYYVKQSTGADSGSCDTTAAPCFSIQGAVDRADDTAGNTVQVLPDAPGATSDYVQVVTLDGPNPITLVGAGPLGGSTHLLNSASTPLSISDGSTVRDMRVTYNGSTNSQRAVNNTGGGTLERVAASAPLAIGYQGGGVFRDGSVSGAIGTLVFGARFVRTRITGTDVGLRTLDSSADLLNCIVAGDGTGIGLQILASSSLAPPPTLVRLRHVTVTGFDTRARVSGVPPTIATLEAANSTLAGPSGTDLHQSGGSKVVFRATNFSESRRAVSSSVNEFTVSEPVDVPPGLTADGHLAPDSALIDRGIGGGVLAGDPDDGLDFDRDARVARAAPDVGADEVPAPPAGPPPGGSPDLDAPGVALGGKRVQRLRRRSFFVFATSDENGQFLGSARVRVPRLGASAIVRARRVRRPAVAGQRTRLVFRLTRKGARRVRRALRVRRRLAVTVRVVTTDAAGNATTTRRRLKLRR